MTRRGRIVGSWVVVASLVACTPPSVEGDPLKAPTSGEAFEGVQCSAVRPQTEPDLMAWDPGSRLKLNALRKDGVVAVRYQAKGCNVELEVLPCVAGGPASYRFEPYSANEHKVAHNANELFAQLPVGAARFAGSVKGNRALRTDYMLAGQYGLPTGTSFKASELRGPRGVCERATHVVSAVYVGAFAMAAGESRAIEASASLLLAQAGGSSHADVESLGEEGSAEACKVSQTEAKENARCAVPLRIGLLALEAPTAPSRAPEPAAPQLAPPAPPPPAPSPARPEPAPPPAVIPPAVAAASQSDSDHDGVPDAMDQCPTQAETMNGFQDADGCPDAVPESVAKVMGTLSGVHFETGSPELLPDSFASLTKVAALLKAFPDLRVEISGHTDNRGDHAGNTALSQRRAESVRAWLVSQGVDGRRLEPRGYGPDRPLAPNLSEEGRAKNRRMELRLIH